MEGVDFLKPGYEIGDFVMEESIGHGAFATVWRAVHKTTLNVVGIKVIKKASLSTSTMQTRLQREVSLLKKMEHPFIAEFFQVIEDANNYFLVMEYVENGNLLEYVNGNGRLSESHARRYFGQLIAALEYLHKDQKVAHRDLKCENILLDRYNNIRLIDFGLSNMFSDVCPELKTACGSPAYAPPEMIQGQPYTQVADIWSAGILLYSLIVGSLPYDDENIQKLLSKIVYTEVNYPSYLSPQLVDLLQKMICKSPEERITLDKIKEHPWFSQNEYESILLYSSAEFSHHNNNSGNTTANGVTSSNADVVIDKEIIDKITSFGIDCHELHNSLLVGEFTNLTALYRILLREKVTEKMKDIMKKIQNIDGGEFAMPNKLQTQPLLHFPCRNNCNATVCVPSTGRKQPIFKCLQVVNNGPTKLGNPAAMGRRLSRPVAIRRPITAQDLNKAPAAKESP